MLWITLGTLAIVVVVSFFIGWFSTRNALRKPEVRIQLRGPDAPPIVLIGGFIGAVTSVVLAIFVPILYVTLTSPEGSHGYRMMWVQHRAAFILLPWASGIFGGLAAVIAGCFAEKKG